MVPSVLSRRAAIEGKICQSHAVGEYSRPDDGNLTLARFSLERRSS